ncbi:hypothetical protein ACQVP2_19945 [Methylobacterium aquaticum]|uniref:hypothetical protein n=1 Tax=Methylobacterium aquaticum TaxID=270351 RepID=UPI003D17B167
MSENWVSIDRAVAHVTEHTVAAHIAESHLYNALTSARIFARGDISILRGGVQVESHIREIMHEKYWLTIKETGSVDWASNFAMCRWSRWVHKDNRSYLEKVEVRSIEVSARQLYELWPPLKPSNVDAGNLFPPHPKKGIGGVQGNYDWLEYLTEAALIMRFGNPRPNTQAELINALLDKYGGPEGGPSPSQMKARIGPLFNRWKEKEADEF